MIMDLIWLIVFTIFLSFIFAKLEIEIEGQGGWAENLPTRRWLFHSWFSRLLWGNRPVTAYHLWSFLFVLFSFHWPAVFFGFSLKGEMITFALICIFCVVEDFLWFVLNPAFGLKNFRPEKIWWHRRSWWLLAPREYFLFLATAALLIWRASLMS